MGRRGLVVALALLALASPGPAQAEPPYVETTALLVTSSHRDFAAARSAALKLHEKLVAKFPDEVGAPSASVGAAEAWRNRHGELFFLDANGLNVNYPSRSSGAGIQVSIGDSGMYPGLVAGYFVVVLASGEPKNIWPLARNVNAAGIRAHVRYSQQVFWGPPCHH